jgi:hypothetical protein
MIPKGISQTSIFKYQIYTLEKEIKFQVTIFVAQSKEFGRGPSGIVSTF